MVHTDLIRGGYAYAYVYTEDNHDSVDVYDAEERETPICRVLDITPAEIHMMGQEEYEEFLYDHLSV